MISAGMHHQQVQKTIILMVVDLQGTSSKNTKPHLLWQVSPSFSWQQISPGCAGSSMIHQQK